MMAAPNSHARTGAGSGAIAIPRIAKVEIMRMSATEEATSHTVGRNPQRWRRPSQGVNGGLAAIYDGNDRKRSQGFDSELHFKLADRDDNYTER